MRRICAALAMLALATAPSLAAGAPANAGGHVRQGHAIRHRAAPVRATLDATYQSTGGGNLDF